jgi:hypothetical protein
MGGAAPLKKEFTRSHEDTEKRLFQGGEPALSESKGPFAAVTLVLNHGQHEPHGKEKRLRINTELADSIRDAIGREACSAALRAAALFVRPASQVTQGHLCGRIIFLVWTAVA